MTLRTVAVADPVPGTDWSYTVPGRYLLDITGITATLRTINTTLQTTMADITGNGNDGTHGNPSLVGLELVPGLVPDDLAIECTHNTIGTAPLVADPVAGDFTIALWIASDDPDAFFNCPIFRGTVNPTVRFQVRGNAFGGFFQLTRVYAGASSDFFTTGTMPFPSGPVFVVAVYDEAANHVEFYLNGTAFPAQSYAAHPMTETSDEVVFGTNGVGVTSTMDEVVVFDTALSAADVSALYAAGLVDWATWQGVVTPLAPFAWWPLDDSGANTNDFVALLVTNGANPVADIPQGSVDVYAGSGPWAYSWQPGLGASSQSPNGGVTTVAIPRLVLPAGYTVGAHTLDLSAADEWSDITIWWDDALMAALDDYNPYIFPPSISLKFLTQGG